jgi:uncharacterized protein YjiS (DUF1127 family)
LYQAIFMSVNHIELEWSVEMSATRATIHPAAPKRSGALSRLVSASCHSIAAYFVRRAAIASLREADDHALWDMGLPRSRIEAAVDGLFSLADQSKDVMLASPAATAKGGGGRRPPATTEALAWS